MNFREKISPPVWKAILVFQLSIAVFGGIFAILFYINGLDTTVEVMSILGDIFLASGAIASAYLASKSLEHRKRVEAHAICGNITNDRFAIKVFNTGRNPILVENAPVLRVNEGKRKINGYLQHLNQGPVLVGAEDSEVLMTLGGEGFSPEGTITIRDFEGNKEKVKLEGPKQVIEAQDKDRMETILDIMEKKVFSGTEQPLSDIHQLFRVSKEGRQSDEILEEIEKEIETALSSH